MALSNLRARCQHSQHEGTRSPSRHSCCVHSVTPQKHMKTETQEEPLGRSTQGILFWMEHSGPFLDGALWFCPSDTEAWSQI